MTNPHTFCSTPDVDLSATRARLLLAREQCASQSSAQHFRTVTEKRRWQTAHQRRAEQTD
jgi:hypothetical protein